MAVRIRKDGRVLCAAMHPRRRGDTYLDDNLHYVLAVELRALVTERMVEEAGRGGHARHGEWWWAQDVPSDVVPDPFYVGSCRVSSPIVLSLSRGDAQALYDHTGTMPHAPDMWTHNVRQALSEVLAAPGGPRLTVDEYGSVWLGEPGEGTVVGDLVDRDEETLQILWRQRHDV